MCLCNWVESKVQRFRWYDISLIKLSTAALVLMIAKLWPPLLSLEWNFYLAIGLFAAVPVVYKMIKKK